MDCSFHVHFKEITLFATYIYICVRSHIDMLDQMCFHHRHECMDSTLCVSIYHLYMRYNCTSSRSHIAEYTYISYISNWGHQWQDDGNLSDVCAIAALCSLLHFRKAEGCDDHRLVATAYVFLRMQADVMLSGCWKITCAILVLVQLVIVIVVLRSTSARQTTTTTATTTPTATTTTTGLGIFHEWGTITCCPHMFLNRSTSEVLQRWILETYPTYDPMGLIRPLRRRTWKSKAIRLKLSR